MRRLLRILVVLAVAWIAAQAHAHKPSDSYLSLAVDGERITGQWDIALRDLDYALGLDADGDDAITWGEVKAKQADIAAYALARLRLGPAAAPCPTRVTGQLVDDHSDGAYAVLRFEATCAAAPKALTVAYRLFFDLDPQHRGLVRIDAQGATRAGILAVDAPEQTYTLAASSRRAQFLDYGEEGVWHIWTGFDHVLFLLSLLLPAVLTRPPSRFVLRYSPFGRPGGLMRSREPAMAAAAPGFAALNPGYSGRQLDEPRRHWEPVTGFRAAFVDVVKVVTAFTLAHSITLSLAALGVVSLPSRLVESAIALSVVLAALNNLRPLVYEKRWLIAFCFGLIHGFGFASVLADLGLPQESLLVALVAFNVGVEVGQLAIVAVFLPLAYSVRRTRFYQRALVGGGSALIALVALAWLVQRAFNLQLIAG